MSLLDRILSFVAPYDCLGCGVEGTLLCAPCRSSLAPSQFVGDAACDTQVATIYGGLAKDLVWKLKSNGAQAAATLMANMIAPLLAGQHHVFLVPVPTATRRVRQRGYDQARLLARELARQTRLPYLDCLVRVSQTHQVGASSQQRAQQLAGAFRIKRRKQLRNARLILIDDVTTTGATFAVAAKTLQRAGCAEVSALAFAWTRPR